MGSPVPALFAALALVLAGGPRAEVEPAALLPGPAEIAGWALTGEPEIWEGEGLYGYINGGSEAFLQYGFQRAAVGRYSGTDGAPDREITVEVYLMGSDREAFGFFSIRREGGGRVPDLSGDHHWTSESQASLAAGPWFVNVVGFGTVEEDLSVVLRLMKRKLEAAGAAPFSVGLRPGPWSHLPKPGLRPDTIRYIRGPIAARDETAFLEPDAWRFAEGAEAASASYDPDGRKLLVVEIRPDSPDPGIAVRDLFDLHLRDIRFADGVLEGRNGAGHVFLFSARERTAWLVFGKTDAAAARALLALALRTD